MVWFLLIALVIAVLVFGVSSFMQSYASAQQAKAVVETAQVAQMATLANLLVIVVMALVIVLVLAGLLYVAIKINKRSASSGTTDRRVDRLEAGRRYGRQLAQVQQDLDAREDEESADMYVVADDVEVDSFLSNFFEDW